MPFYSREDCERVREANDIVDVISGYVNLKKQGSRYFGLCPFHNEKSPSFCVSEQSQLYHCFGCHESGNVVSFLMKYQNLEYPEAIEELADRIGYKLESAKGNSQESAAIRNKKEQLYAANRAAGIYYYRYLRSPEGKKGVEYFREREVRTNVANAFGIGYTGISGKGLYEHLKKEGFSDEIMRDAGLVVFDEKQGARDRFFNRVMFPIFDDNKKVVGFGGRVLGDAKPKYLNSAESEIFQKKNILYGFFAAKKSRKKYYVLCEGYMDVIAAHQAGFDNFVATLGTALSTEHALKLKRLKAPVVLCYDSDNAGKEAAKRGYNILRECGVNSKIMTLAPYKDPDEFIKAQGAVEFEKRIESAKNAFLVIARWDYEKINPANPDELNLFLHDMAQRVSDFEDNQEKEVYINAIGREFGTSADTFRNLVREKLKLSADEGEKKKPVYVNKKDVKSSGSNDNLSASMIYFLLNEDFYKKTEGIIKEDDFENNDLREIYKYINEAYKNNEKLTPAQLLDVVEDEGINKLITKTIFEASEDAPGEKTGSRMAPMLLDFKKKSINRQNASIQDTALLDEVFRDTSKILDSIRDMKF